LSATWPIRRCAEAEGLRVRADIANDLAAVERQIADNERELNASEGVLSNLPAARYDATHVSITPANECGCGGPATAAAPFFGNQEGRVATTSVETPNFRNGVLSIRGMSRRYVAITPAGSHR
jgi:hypothetical protein